MRGLVSLVLPALLAAACGPPGGGGSTVAPHLPGEGDGGDKKPPPEAEDPWAGRKGMIEAPALAPVAPIGLAFFTPFGLSIAAFEVALSANRFNSPGRTRPIGRIPAFWCSSTPVASFTPEKAHRLRGVCVLLTGASSKLGRQMS